MVDLRLKQKIGKKLFLIFLFCLTGPRSFASEVQFSAEVDQTKIGLDDTVTLTLKIKSDSNAGTGEPHFEAPDFDVVNKFNSISVSSQYDSNSGQISMVNHQQVSEVLKPRKEGQLKITAIQMSSAGKTLKAPDIVIHVAKGSTAPSQQFTQGGGRPSSRMGGVGNRSREAEGAAPAFVRAELDKTSAYKGEQVVVSYYIYYQGKVFNFQVDKFPILNRFLREDLDTPIMSQRLEPESALLNGVPYNRALLVRYAAYPLEDGKLNIDSLSIKFNYYTSMHGSDQEDPFFGFFQQLAPRVGAAKSEIVSLSVLPLPTENRPENYSGGIGEFTVTSALDKYEVRANEALTLTVKVDGRGNVASIQEPKVKWPDSLEMYSSKGKAQSGKGGAGQKVFEVLLIPRVPGLLKLPPIEMSFFDPVSKHYYSKSSPGFDVQVQPPAPGTALVPVKSGAAVGTESGLALSAKAEDLRYLKPPASDGMSWVQLLERGLYMIYGWVLGLFAFFMGLDFFNRHRKARESIVKKSPDWKNLYSLAHRSQGDLSWQELMDAYEAIAQRIFDALDRIYPEGTRSLPRSQLEQIFVHEQGLSKMAWDRIESLFEYIDLIRFASSGRTEMEPTVRKDLLKWVSEGEALDRLLAQVPK